MLLLTFLVKTLLTRCAVSRGPWPLGWGCAAGRPWVGPVPARSFTLEGVCGKDGLRELGTHLPPLLFAEKQSQASASPGSAGRLHQVRGAYPGLRRGHRGGLAGVRRHLLPATQRSPQAEGEALGTGGGPGPRCHQRLPGKETLFSVRCPLRSPLEQALPRAQQLFIVWVLL